MQNPEKHNITFTVNGERVAVNVPPTTTLVQVLRDELSLTGTKVGCGEGECGACSVLFNGKLVNSCLVLAGECQGAEVLTIEGLAREGHLHPIQESFVRNGAVQCGFCTPGMIMSTYALLAENPAPTASQVQRSLEGNLCRCTGYQKIVDAILESASKLREQASPEASGAASPSASAGTDAARVAKGDDHG